MPQLVKGGKYVFGWTRISKDFKIRIPDETYDEYHFNETDKLIVISGSKSSGGFSIITPNSIINSKISKNIIRSIGYKRESNSFTNNKLEIVKHGDRFISWTSIENKKYFRLSQELLTSFNVNIKDRLLVGRGSGLGPAFIGKGTIYQEAIKHDLPEF